MGKIEFGILSCDEEGRFMLPFPITDEKLNEWMMIPEVAEMLEKRFPDKSLMGPFDLKKTYLLNLIYYVFRTMLESDPDTFFKMCTELDTTDAVWSTFCEVSGKLSECIEGDGPGEDDETEKGDQPGDTVENG